MQEQYYFIGEMAGKIYDTLEEKGETTSAKLQKSVGADDDLFQQALGWLAREGKINILKKGKSTKLSLCQICSD